MGMANHDFESLSPDELTSLSPFTSSCANTAPGCGKSFNNRLFQHIKEALVSSGVLSHFDPDWPTITSTDTSNTGIDKVLTRVQEMANAV